MKRFSFPVTLLCATTLLIGVVSAQKPPGKPANVLEGVLRIHPKFHYRYYIDGFGDGQKCALFQADKQLKQIKPGSRIRVRGDLASKLLGGDPKDQRSALTRTWILYMDVHQVHVLDGPVSAAPPQGPRSQRNPNKANDTSVAATHNSKKELGYSPARQ